MDRWSPMRKLVHSLHGLRAGSIAARKSPSNSTPKMPVAIVGLLPCQTPSAGREDPLTFLRQQTQKCMLRYCMQLPVSAQAFIAAFVSFGWCATVPVEVIAQPLTTPSIPRTWEDVPVSTMEVPLAQPERSPVHVTSEYYYRMPERTIYKSYPVFDLARQPAGYIEWLRRQEPEISFDSAQLKTSTWIKAGERVFEAPFSYNAWTTSDDLQKKEWWKAVNPPVTREGVLPYVRYVVRTKGQVEVSSFSCAQCHIRVLDGGSVIAGAQGNYPLGRAQAVALRRSNREAVMLVEQSNYAAPWLGAMDPFVRLSAMTLEELAAGRELIPSGVNSRPLTSPFSPAQIPDLIGVKDRRYLDHTGLMQHRDIGDLMRYAAANQDASVLARHGDFSPVAVLPQPEKSRARYSDEQLYALALYLLPQTARQSKQVGRFS